MKEEVPDTVDKKEVNVLNELQIRIDMSASKRTSGDLHGKVFSFFFLPSIFDLPVLFLEACLFSASALRLPFGGAFFPFCSRELGSCQAMTAQNRLSSKTAGTCGACEWICPARYRGKARHLALTRIQYDDCQSTRRGPSTYCAFGGDNQGRIRGKRGIWRRSTRTAEFSTVYSVVCNTLYYSRITLLFDSTARASLRGI